MFSSSLKCRRRLPRSLFIFKQHNQHYFNINNNNNRNNNRCSFLPLSTSRFYHIRRKNNTAAGHVSTFRDVKFGGRVTYSRTLEEVERAADELLDFVEAKKTKEGQCILGIDIEWRPSFRTGVAPGKAAVLQICGENNCCHVLHIIHSGIPKRLQWLLEDPTSIKVGVAVGSDASKLLRDHNVSINGLEDLSNLADRKLSGDLKKWKWSKWSLSSLTKTLIFRQLPKPNMIRLGNWEEEVLTKEQLNYAATDAYISWYLYQVLKNLPDIPDNKNEETVGAT